MSDQHARMCPVMADDARCITVGGTDSHHDRGRAGDCRCGVKCQCELVNAVRESEKAKADLAISFWAHENDTLRQRFTDMRAKVERLPKAKVTGVLYAQDDVLDRDEVLALFDEDEKTERMCEFEIVCDGDPFMDGTHERRVLGRFTSLTALQQGYINVVARSKRDPKANLRMERRLVTPWEVVKEASDGATK